MILKCFVFIDLNTQYGIEPSGVAKLVGDSPFASAVATEIL